MWIETDLAVPKKPYRVLIKIDFGDNSTIVDIGEYYGCGSWECNGQSVKVVAWMPLPE